MNRVAVAGPQPWVATHGKREKPHEPRSGGRIPAVGANPRET